MVSPRYRNVILFVKAVDGKDVREIDENGKPMMAMRVVGKKSEIVDPQNNLICFNVVKDGVQIPYHSHYIARLKEGSLLPMDHATAQLAGVKFSEGNK